MLWQTRRNKFQSDDAADYKWRKREIAIGDAARLQLSQMIAAEQEQTLTAAELIYMDGI